MWTSIAHISEHRTAGYMVQPADIALPQSATLGLHLVARKLLLISHTDEGKRLSCPA